MVVPRRATAGTAGSTGTGTRSDSGQNSNNKSNNVRVVGRIRPLAKYEIRNGSKVVVTKLPGYQQYDEHNNAVAGPDTLQIEDENNPNDSHSSHRYYELDAVLDDTSTQNDVYEKSGARNAIAEDLFCGYNATILAYGQTGSGKTFTMGTAQSATATNTNTNTNTSNDRNRQNEGVIPRACHDLFDTIRERCDGQAKVKCSYMEVYNEKIRDLLVERDTRTYGTAARRKQKLRIRETLDGTIYVGGLTERVVKSPLDVYKIMEEANKRRVTASTKMNATSSRSHAICILRIKGVVVFADENKDSSGDDENENSDDNSEDNSDDGVSRTFEAKLTLVDLAGSERLEKTQATGKRAKEGISINKGLFVLGQVISALAERGRILKQIEEQNGTSTTKRRKVLPPRKPPYRDSKLTRLLQDSLGGNSRTIMIACVSPADFNVEDTVNTLRYATHARNISNTATANLIETIGQDEARKLKRENTLLKQQIADLEETIAKFTQDVTPDDLERSMSIIQMEQNQYSLQQQADRTRRQNRRNSAFSAKALEALPDITAEELCDLPLEGNATHGFSYTNQAGDDDDDDDDEEDNNMNGDTTHQSNVIYINSKEEAANATLEEDFEQPRLGKERKSHDSNEEKNCMDAVEALHKSIAEELIDLPLEDNATHGFLYANQAEDDDEDNSGDNNDDMNGDTNHQSNAADAEENEKATNTTLEKDSELSRFSEESESIDSDEEKDCVSLLVDDVFATRSLVESVGARSPTRQTSTQRVRPTFTQRISSRGNGNSNSNDDHGSVDSTRIIEELEDENMELEARLLLAERDIRATAYDAGVTLPALKKRVRQLEDDLSESKWLENEALDLQEQLSEARTDKESAQRAAKQLNECMLRQKQETESGGDKLLLKQLDYCRLKVNEDWVKLVSVVLNFFQEVMRRLRDYFHLVFKVVVCKVIDAPDILEMLGIQNNQERKLIQNAGVGWWKSKEQKEKELRAVEAEERAVEAEKQLRNDLLKEHIAFFNDRLLEIEEDVNFRNESIHIILKRLSNAREILEIEYQSAEEVDSVRDLFSKKGEELLKELTMLMTEETDYTPKEKPGVVSLANNEQEIKTENEESGCVDDSESKEVEDEKSYVETAVQLGATL